MVCKKVFENWLRNEDTASILVYYNGNSNLSTVRHTDLHTKSDQSKRSLTGSHVGGLSTYRVLGTTKKVMKTMVAIEDIMVAIMKETMEETMMKIMKEIVVATMEEQLVGIMVNKMEDIMAETMVGTKMKEMTVRLFYSLNQQRLKQLSSQNIRLKEEREKTYEKAKHPEEL